MIAVCLWRDLTRPPQSCKIAIHLDGSAQESKIASEREAGKSHQESAMQRTHELEAMKSLLSANH